MQVPLLLATHIRRSPPPGKSSPNFLGNHPSPTLSYTNRVEGTLLQLQGWVLSKSQTKSTSSPLGDRDGFKNRLASQFQDSDGYYTDRAPLLPWIEQYGKQSLQGLQLSGQCEARAGRCPKRDANTMNGRTERVRKARPLVTLSCPLGPAMPEVKSYHETFRVWYKSIHSRDRLSKSTLGCL